MKGFPAISAARQGAPGGIGYFGVKITGYEGKEITLVINRVGGQSGSAIFEDTGTNFETVTGDCDCYVKVRGQDVSNIARNLEVQAYPPVPEAGPVSTVSFSVFWALATTRNWGSVPDDGWGDAWGARGPIADEVRRKRQDHQNQLGIALEDQFTVRGHKLTTYPIFPYDLDPDDLRRSGPTNGFDIQRLMTARYYFDCKLTNQNNVDGFNESSAAIAKDIIADRPPYGGPLKLYDWDAPSLNYPFASINRNVDHDMRARANFVEWATYTDDDGTDNRVCAENIWFFRAAWHWDSKAGNLTLRGEDLDNMVGAGTTNLTCDLSPSKDPDIAITGFTPNTSPNFAPFVDVRIFGNFPPLGAGCDELQAYLTAEPADSSGDPRMPDDEDFYPALGVNRLPDGSLIARFPLQRRGTVIKTALPLPAKTYQIKVVSGTKYAQMGDFTLTENPMVRWQLMPTITQDIVSITAAAVALDAAGHVVTRPGAPRPTFQRTAGVLLSPFDNYGRYGEYWGIANIVNPGDTGPVTIRVSGGEGAPDERQYPIK
jgi:hypothetical protein